MPNAKDLADIKGKGDMDPPSMEDAATKASPIEDSTVAILPLALVSPSIEDTSETLPPSTIDRGEIQELSSKEGGFPKLYRMANRAVLFLALLVSSFGVFYVVGNFQRFQDLTLNALLLLLTFLAILLFLATVLAMVQYLLFMILSRYRPRVRFIIVYLFLIVYSCLIAVVSIVITYITSGIA